MEHYKYIFTELIIIILLSVMGVSPAFCINHLTKDGLSQVSVISITQDSLGNLWFGTRNGVNRYDGSNITVYKTDRDNINSISGNHIEHMEYQNNSVWLQTKNAISSFDIQTEKFTNYTINNIVHFTIENEKIWIANKKSIFNLFDYNDTIPLRLDTDEEVYTFVVYRNRMLIGTNKQVLDLELKTKESTVIKAQTDVTSLFVDSRRNIWIGTTDDGLFRIAPNDEIKHFRGAIDIVSKSIRCFEEADDGSIWVGTFLGLEVISIKDEITHYQYNKVLRSTISHNSVRSLFKDSNGTIWVGTYFGGVDYFYPNGDLFHYYPENLTNNSGVSYRVIGNMTYDIDNNLWICTEGEGLNYFDRAKDHFVYYKLPKNKYGFSSQNLKAIYNENNTKLWIGTFRGGLFSFDILSKTFESYPNVNNGKYLVSQNIISSIVPYGNKYIVGTHMGLYLFDPESGVFEEMLFDSSGKHRLLKVASLLIDNEGALWVGTEYSGLFSYNFETHKLKNYSVTSEKSIADNFVYDIFQDSHSNLWIATSNGLNCYVPSLDDFEYYSEEEGLPNNFVLCLDESLTGNLIVTTSKGVSFIDASSTPKTITDINGLPLRELNQGGLCVLPNDEVFLGGIDGLTYFNIDDFLQKNINNSPQISQLRVNNKIVTPGDETGILDKSIMITPSIVLEHFHTGFSIRYTDGNFIESEKQSLEYKLIGFDDDWVISNGNEANYTNLDVGQYLFILRNKNKHSLQTELQIRIRPSIYKTLIARLIYFLLAVSLIFYIYYFLIQQREQRKEKILNQSKLRFFTNISHEFRTPLTLITGQTEMLMENTYSNPSDYKKILNIHKNTVRLKNLITELLDFRKQEQGFLKLKVGEYDVVEFLEEIYHSFIELSKHTHIIYQIRYQNKPIMLWFDRVQMEKVFYNLLSNAFKFTPEHGQIIVRVEEEQEALLVQVIDTGKGMSQEYVDEIFDRFCQLDNISFDENRGTGIGLALTKGIVETHQGSIKVKSSLTSGSTFSVRIKYGKTHFSKGELISNVADDHIASNIEELAPQAIMSSHKKDKLLIVEDNPEVQRFLVELLSPLFETSTANDGLEGFDFAKKSQPDVILSDVLMPRMSGTEMCSKLKMTLETSHIPIVLLTARTAEEYKVEGLDTGADDYITKPFNTKILVARLNNILNNRRILQRLVLANPLTTDNHLAKNRIDREFMDKARDFINTNIDNSDYDVISFASDMNIGRTMLFSKIKAITGKTPNDFINSIRLEKSIHLLKLNSTTTIAEIAYSCGFTTPDYFGKLFKKRFGITPSQWLRKHRMPSSD